jgi:hypothetical protein
VKEIMPWLLTVELRDRGRCGSFGNLVAGDSAERPLPGQFRGAERGKGGQCDPRAGFCAMTTSIAFRCGTPLAVEMNSTCPESKIFQSQ